MEESECRFLRQEAEIRRLNRLYSVLSQVTQSVLRSKSQDELLTQVCASAVNFGEFKCAWVGMIDSETQQIVPVASAGDIQGLSYIERIQVFVDDRKEGHGPCGIAARENRPFICNDFANDPITLPWREFGAEAGIESLISLPIEIGGRICGLLNVYSGERNFFQAREVMLLQEVAGDVSFALNHLDQEAQRCRDEEALTRRLRQLSRAVEQSPCSVVITDTEGRIEYVNPKFTAITGYTLEEVVGQKPSLLKSGHTPRETYTKLWDTITAGREWRGEFQCKKKNGDLFWESASICPIHSRSGRITHYLCVKEDITERKQMEENLLRAQRLESIGSLAAGVAHDLNNILAPIMMSASMLNDDLPSSTRRELVTTIEEAAQRGAEIVRQVLTFARGVEGRRATLNPEIVINQVFRIIRETFPKSIDFKQFVPEDIWHINGDLTQLHQVLLNLAVNARDAMPSGGTLDLSARNYAFSETTAPIFPAAKAGRYVIMEVRDSGSGIPARTIDRVFEPFFTTKGHGQGTGLGLSTALGIIRSHGGFMHVTSEEGEGSLFQVFIPAN